MPGRAGYCRQLPAAACSAGQSCRYHPSYGRVTNRIPVPRMQDNGMDRLEVSVCSTGQPHRSIPDRLPRYCLASNLHVNETSMRRGRRGKCCVPLLYPVVPHHKYPKGKPGITAGSKHCSLFPTLQRGPACDGRHTLCTAREEDAEATTGHRLCRPVQHTSQLLF